MTKVINLFAGSGAGKSTTACSIFAKMKMAGKEVELVREFVKELAWEGRTIEPYQQIWILGNQIQREIPLYGKVDYIVTDSPIMLGGFYTEYHNKNPHITNALLDVLVRQKDNCEHHNFFIKRRKAFNPKGRYETEEEAIMIDKLLKLYLEKNNIPFTEIDGEVEEDANKIIDLVTLKESK